MASGDRRMSRNNGFGTSFAFPRPLSKKDTGPYHTLGPGEPAKKSEAESVDERTPICCDCVACFRSRVGSQKAVGPTAQAAFTLEKALSAACAWQERHGLNVTASELGSPQVSWSGSASSQE